MLVHGFCFFKLVFIGPKELSLLTYLYLQPIPGEPGPAGEDGPNVSFQRIGRVAIIFSSTQNTV